MEIEFPQGLPGFEDERQFVLTRHPDLLSLFRLQSAVSPRLCLWAAAVDAIDPDYCLDLSEEDLRVLDVESGAAPEPCVDLECLAIICAPENGPVTANLLAPLVLNLRNGRAVQAVRADRRYSHRHPILAEAAC